MLYLATPVASNPPTQGFPWGDLRKIFTKRSGIAKVPNGREMQFIYRGQYQMRETPYSSPTFPPTGLTPRTLAVFSFSQECQF